MFERVMLHGRRASILLGWHPAAVLDWWRIDHPKHQATWMLTGGVKWADAFLCRKPGLLFTAPRDHTGMWAWGIEELRIEHGKLKARLGPPEQ